MPDFFSAAWTSSVWGHDPRFVEAPIQRVATPPAQHYDGQTKDWQCDSDGVPLPAHPVDVGMVLSFIDPRNNDLRSIRYYGGADMQAKIDDAVKNAQPAKRLIAEGKASIVEVRREESAQGFKLLIRYKNLVTGQSNTVTA